METFNCLIVLFLIWFLWITGISEHIVELIFFGKSTIEILDKEGNNGKNAV